MSGSSPLSRGIPAGDARMAIAGRIIPALAGNTRARSSHRTGCWDHPRSRGEYGGGGGCRYASRGSSPLSRGIRNRKSQSWFSAGIIPALAGNTRPSGSQAPTRRDHPRSRGEYMLAGDVLRQLPGSSPLSRGIRRLDRGVAGRRGIIPALAGNTQTSSKKKKQSRDHPRSRGEYRPKGFVRQSLNGSSPLSRGIPRTL